MDEGMVEVLDMGELGRHEQRLSNFDRGQLVMTRCLGWSILEMARLVGWP